jgi:hypothetical protein
VNLSRVGKEMWWSTSTFSKLPFHPEKDLEKD